MVKQAGAERVTSVRRSGQRRERLFMQWSATRDRWRVVV